MSLKLLLLLLLAQPCCAQLLLANAADGSVGSFAPGSLLYFAVTDTTDLSLTTVTIGPSTTLPILGLLPTSIGIIRLPPDLPLGTATAFATVNGKSIPSVTFNVVPVSFGIFTTPTTAGLLFESFGLASAEQIYPGTSAKFALRNDGSAAALASPAHPGDNLTIYGTGLGSTTLAQVSIAIAGQPVPITYVGPSGGSPGLDQINFQIPSNFIAPDSCDDSFNVTVAGTQLNPKPLSYTQTATTCPSSIGFNATELAALDAGTPVPFVQLNLQSAIRPATSQDNVGNGFTRSEFALSFERTDLPVPSLNTVDSAFYGCQLQPPSLLSAELSQAYSGLSLTLGAVSMPVGPSVNSPSLPAAVSAPSSLPAALYQKGTWQLSAPSFLQPLPLPAPIQLANFSALQSIDSTHDLTVTWDPSSYSSSDVLTLSLAAPLNPFFTSSSAVCTVHATDGVVTLPSAQLQAIPKAVSLTAIIYSHPDATPNFRLPQANGSTLPLQVVYNFSETFPVTLH